MDTSILAADPVVIGSAVNVLNLDKEASKKTIANYIALKNSFMPSSIGVSGYGMHPKLGPRRSVNLLFGLNPSLLSYAG